MKRKTQRKAKALGRPAGSSGDITRARIIGAAREAFGNTGYAATTNKQIAAAAGITAAAIYRYFDSKVALYMATVTGALKELEDALQVARDRSPAGRQTLVALAHAAGQLHEERPYLAAFLSSLPVEMQRNPEIAEAMTAEVDPISRMVAEAVEDAAELGQIAEHLDTEQVTSMIIACNIGLSLWGSAISDTPSRRPMETFAALLDGVLFR